MVRGEEITFCSSVCGEFGSSKVMESESVVNV